MFRIQILGLDLYGCQEALERLDLYIDRELSPDEQAKVSQHLRICHECARKFRFEADLSAGLRDKVQKVLLTDDVDALQSKIAALLQRERTEERIEERHDEAANNSAT